ncbi:MAG: hypothetical protein ACYCSO_05245 [Cuniculiplasma sp.]
MIKVEDVSRIVSLTEREVGTTEENVKQKIMVPLLEILGHRRQDLEFEYTTRNGGRIDIFIKNVPIDCKVLIDTKNYNEKLADYVDQIKDYTFSESALISILVNGTEIWIYSPLRGVAFERSMLYAIKRENLSKESELQILDNLLSYENLKNRKVIEYVGLRENQIKDVMTKVDGIEDDLRNGIEGINEELENKKSEIEELEKEKLRLKEKVESNIRELWKTLALPGIPYRPQRAVTSVSIIDSLEDRTKARKVSLREAVDKNLLKDKQVLYFFHGRMYKDETAEVNYKEDKLLYHTDNKLYSVSDLAKKIDIKVGLKRDNHGVAGPRYWKTQDGRLLNDINEEIRGKV